MDYHKFEAWKDLVSLAKSLFGENDQTSTPEEPANLGLRLVKGLHKDSHFLVGAYSNNFEDREGEIISESAHREFIAWANEKGFHPFVAIHHQPNLSARSVVKLFVNHGDDVDVLNEALEAVYKDHGFGVARVERFFYLNGFAMFSARVLDDKVPTVQVALEKGNAAMSHGFVSFELSDTGVHESYRAYELSILARDRAANLFTDPDIGGTMSKSKGKGLSDQDRDYLRDTLGEEITETIEVKTQEAEESLQQFLSRKLFNRDDPVSDSSDASDDEVTTEPSDSADTETDKPTLEGDENNLEERENEVSIAKEETSSTPDSSEKVSDVAGEVVDMLGIDGLSNVIDLLIKSNKHLVEVLESQEARLVTLEEKKETSDELVAKEYKTYAWTAYESPTESSKNIVDDSTKYEGPSDPGQKEDKPTDDQKFLASMLGGMSHSNGRR